MSYKWKPSASARRAFAERMQDPQEQAAYQERKTAKEDKRRAGSSFSYASAGGNYVPTEHQYGVCWKILADGDATIVQQSAANIVMGGYSCQDKVHHDYIHIVNEYYRSHL